MIRIRSWRKWLILAFGLIWGGNALWSQEVRLDWKACLERMLQNNPEVRAASTGYLNAEGRAIGLRAILYPTLQAQALTFPAIAYFKIEQTLYDRAQAPQLQLARLSQGQAEANFRATLVEAVYQTRLAYIQVLAASEVSRLRAAQTVICGKAITDGNSLFEAGRIRKSDLQRLEVRRSLARDAEVQAGADQAAAIKQLERVLGAAFEPGSLLEGGVGNEALPELDVATLVREAMENRPDYLMLKGMKKADEARLQLSTRPLFPVLSASNVSAFQAFSSGLGNFDPQRNDNEPNIQRRDGDSQSAFQLRLSWMFFDGGISEGQKNVARADLVDRATALAAMEKAIPAEIALSVEGVRTARVTLETLAAQPRPEDIRAMGDQDLSQKKITYLSRCLLEDELLATRLRELQARTKISLYAAALAHSLGRVAAFDSP
ncbi:MAG: TolC family protein [Candidatus Methylacidiphilales bacterium]|nr:TolC family protein [Candidatus Methylacidiphilales bacterium]